MPSELFPLRMDTACSTKHASQSRCKQESLGPIPQAAVGAVSLGLLQLASYPLSLS